MRLLLSTLLLAALGLVSCAAPKHATNAVPPAAVTSPPATAVPVESNPPGDIPDSQAFVDYRSAPRRYHLQVPEGWARPEPPSPVVFADKLASLRVPIGSASRSP